MYEDLISQLDSYIKANANNEITGAGLNVILNSMLNALGDGMRFYGLATTSTQPVVNQIPKFYVAFRPGVYSRFVESQPAFTSGFAILYDVAGTNEWAIAVKSFETGGSSGFLVNAQVRKNSFSNDSRFYIGSARVANGISTFTVYSTIDNGSERDSVAAVFTSSEALTGLMTHRVVGINGTVFYVSVDWDKLVYNEETEFTYYDTSFPSMAYVDTSDDVDFEEMLQPYVKATSLRTVGGYSIIGQGDIPFPEDELLFIEARKIDGTDFYTLGIPSKEFIDISAIKCTIVKVDDLWFYYLNTSTTTFVTFFLSFIIDNRVNGLRVLTLKNGADPGDPDAPWEILKADIPAAPGTLNTNNSNSLPTSPSESLSLAINLHKVAKTGDYRHLLNTPDIPNIYICDGDVSGSTVTLNVNIQTLYTKAESNLLFCVLHVPNSIDIVLHGTVTSNNLVIFTGLISVNGSTAECYILNYDNQNQVWVLSTFSLTQSTLPSIAGKAGMILSVNESETDVEWIPVPGGGGSSIVSSEIPSGTVSNSDATDKVVSITGISELTDGLMIRVKNNNVRSSGNTTLNLNNLGARPIFTYADNSAIRLTTQWQINTAYIFVYSTRENPVGRWYVVGRIPDLSEHGLCNVICSTASDVLAKVASTQNGNYSKNIDSLLSVKFVEDVLANSTLSIDNQTVSNIYFRGVALVDNIIKAGDTAIFNYDGSNYNLLNIDRWGLDEIYYFDFNADVPITDITNNILIANFQSFSQQDWRDYIARETENKNIRYRLRYEKSSNLYYATLQKLMPFTRNVITDIVNVQGYTLLQDSFETTLISKVADYCFTIKLTISHFRETYNDETSENFNVNAIWNLETITNPQLIRTVNEELLLGSKNDANLHDGFYFPNAVQDYDGNWYGAVIIGNQVWLAENLKSLHYSDGTALPIDNYNNDRYPHCNYPNADENNLEQYGLLYNWVAATRNENSAVVEGYIRGIAPGTEQNGDNIWHIPTKTEFSTLVTYLRNQNRYKANTAKASASAKLWSSGSVGTDADKNNKTGLGLVPAGYSANNQPGGLFNTAAYCWASTLSTDPSSGINVRIGCFLKVAQNDTHVSVATTMMAYYKMSVRCVSDLTPYQFRNWYIQQYGSLQHIIQEETFTQQQADWTEDDVTSPAHILHKPDLSALSGIYMPNICNVKFHTLSNGLGRNAIYEQVESTWLPISTNLIKFSLSAPHSWMLENILTNNGGLPATGTSKFGIRFERLKHGSWRGIGADANFRITNLVICGPDAQEIPEGHLYYNKDVSAFDYILGEKNYADFAADTQYFVPMGDSKNGFIFYKSGNILIKKEYSFNNYMFIPFTSEYMDFYEVHRTSDENTLFEYVFTLKTVNTKNLMDRVTFKYGKAYRDILQLGTNEELPQFHKFKFNNKRIDIKGLINATEAWYASAAVLSYYDFNNIQSGTNVPMTNRFSFKCRMGVCTYNNTEIIDSIYPQVGNWQEFNVILGITHKEREAADQAGYFSQSNMVFIRGKATKGKIKV